MRWWLSVSRDSPIRACFHPFQSKALYSQPQRLMLDVNVSSPLGQGASPQRKAKYRQREKTLPSPSAGCLPDKLHSSFFISSALLFPACGINPHGPLPGFLSPLDLRHHCLIITLFSVPSPNSILWFLYLLPVFPLHLAPSHPPRAFLSTPFCFCFF